MLGVVLVLRGRAGVDADLFEEFVEVLVGRLGDRLDLLGLAGREELVVFQSVAFLIVFTSDFVEFLPPEPSSVVIDVVLFDRHLR